MKRSPSACFLAISVIAALSLPTWSYSGDPAKSGSLQPGDLVGVCGDSITEQKMYSLFIADYMLMCQPQPKLSTIQFGWSGEKAGSFVTRMDNDAMVFKPTVATTCYGT